MNLMEAKKILQRKGYSIIREAYEDANETQMTDMTTRLGQYIKDGSEFKIKSKSNPLGLVVYIENNDNYYTIMNANTSTAIGGADNIDDLIKDIYRIQANLKEYQAEESLILDMHRIIADGLNKYKYVIIPDVEPLNKYFEMNPDASVCHGGQVYLHGAAEEEAGYDIAIVISADGSTTLPDGENRVGVLTKSGIKPGIMRTWARSYGAKSLMTGLITYLSDIKFGNDSKKKYTNKVFEL